MIFIWHFIILTLITPCMSEEVITNCTFEEENRNECMLSNSVAHGQGSNTDMYYSWKIESCSVTGHFDHTYRNESGHLIGRHISPNEDENPTLFLSSLQGGGNIRMSFWYKMNANETTVRVKSDHNWKIFTWKGAISDWKEGLFWSEVTNGEVIKIESFSNNNDGAKVQIDDIVVQLTRPEEERPMEDVQKDIEVTLTVPNRETNQFIMKRKSANDVRPSSAAIGSVLGIGIFIVMVCFVIIPDIPKIIYDLKNGVEYPYPKKRKNNEKSQTRQKITYNKRRKRLSAVEEEPPIQIEDHVRI